MITLLLVIGTPVLIASVIFLAFHLDSKKYPDVAAELAATGIAADAAILESKAITVPRGTTKLVVAVILEVRPGERSPYRATVNKTVTLLTMHEYSVGAVVKVLIDPRDPNRVGIVGPAAPKAPQSPSASRP